MHSKGIKYMFSKLKQFGRSVSQSFKTISTLNDRFVYVNSIKFHGDQDYYPQCVDKLLECIGTKYVKLLIDLDIEVFIAPRSAGTTMSNMLDSLRGLGGVYMHEGNPILIIDHDRLLSETQGLSQYQSIITLESFLAHEFKHIEQIRSGKLKIYRENGESIVEWCGSKYLFNYINSLPLAMYDDLPWEQEAVIAEIEYLYQLGYIANMEQGWELRRNQYKVLDKQRHPSL